MKTLSDNLNEMYWNSFKLWSLAECLQLLHSITFQFAMSATLIRRKLFRNCSQLNSSVADVTTFYEPIKIFFCFFFMIGSDARDSAR